MMIIECSECGARVEAEEIGSYQYLRTEDKPSGRFVLLRCKQCNCPILACQDNVGNMADGDVWGSASVLYPRQDAHTNPSAPGPIQNAFRDAAASFRCGAYTASAIMCRKTLEGVCHCQGATGRTLAESIEELRQDGAIDSRLHEWSTALRMAGNEAAHDVEVTISKEDARDMLDFTNAIIDYLFSFRDKFERFKARRDKKVDPDALADI